MKISMNLVIVLSILSILEAKIKAMTIIILISLIIIHKNLSDRMRQKIFDMYDNPHEIIKFLKSNGLTLAFTEDINKARDFYTVFNQRRLEIEGKC